jgi:hypothetical protein
MTVVDAYGATMTGGRLADEYRRSLRKTGSDDLRPLMAARVTQETIDAVAPVMARITVAGATYHPDPDGGLAYLIPVRVDNPLTPEAADPVHTVRSGDIVDILSMHPAHPRRWALRRDAAEWLGAIEPQYLNPDPVCVWRSPLGWLRAGCHGLVILSRERAGAYRILAGCQGGIIAEDAEHAAKLHGILTQPWPAPQIIVPKGARHAA